MSVDLQANYWRREEAHAVNECLVSRLKNIIAALLAVSRPSLINDVSACVLLT